MTGYSSDFTTRYLDLIAGNARGPSATVKRGLLRAASWGYGAGVWVRNRLFDRGWRRIERAAVPVVSIGNLTLGGTGKTPCVEYVARHFSKCGLRVAILSRGYGRADGPNDEALVLEENLSDVPHLQGADRVALAHLAVEELESELLVLDDGFQHRRLARSLDLVLIDATQPWGFGYLFPRGLLRESPRELRRADAVIITRCDLVSESELAKLREAVARFAPARPIIEAIHRPVALTNSAGESLVLDRLAGAPVAAFCGIGNPDSFRRTLEQLGAQVRLWRTFPDHFGYRRRDVEDLETWAEALPESGIVLTTQKDMVKLRLALMGGRPAWALKIELSIREGEETLKQLLDRVAE